MYLQRLELIGFKSFAERTVLEFLPPSAASKGITAVVGPNGSGKSNVADALRWVLGEQSTKLLRGKKAEDVIFSGSEKRARSGFAEATLILNNEDGKLPMDLTEVAITRRVYRDGESEYLINKNKVRLGDIQLLLAQAQFGARTYAVIGQGMADSILLATPLERKEFFDEAAGVRQFQLKRQQAVSKLDGARENLAQAELLIAEIEPRLRSLARQVKRLEDRGVLEEELHAKTHAYYGSLWTTLEAQLKNRRAALADLERSWQDKDTMREAAMLELSKLEKEESGSDEFKHLRERYEKLVEERSKLREREIRIASQFEISEQVAKKVATALPLSKIIEEVGKIGAQQDALIGRIKKAKSLDEVRTIVAELEALRDSAFDLRNRLERPTPEKSASSKDPALVRELAEITASSAELSASIASAQRDMQAFNDHERQKKEKFFSLQRGLQEKISSAHVMERKLNEERIETARLETRRETLEKEIAAELRENAARVTNAFAGEIMAHPEALLPEIQRLKYQLQLIGGIDPEAVREYEEIKQRHEFLGAQIADMHKAVADTERIIVELDLTIKARSESAFRNLNRDFDRFFKMLFEGGHASLVQMTASDEAEEEPTESPDEQPKEKSDAIVGIDIQATPPGKKIKSIAMLSGGERALVSIALICAIMTNNPSPFVVLDEVDAALDESNAARFASIVSELAEKTQFIVITHNRYTMRQANVLYGVTMRTDGTSLLLSVNLDQVGSLKSIAQSQ